MKHEQQAAQKLVELKAKLVEAGVEFTEGKLRDVHTWACDTDESFDEACLIVNGYAVSWDYWGYVADKPGLLDHEVLDQQPDVDAVIQFIKG